MGDGISNAVRTIVMVAVAAGILLIGMSLGQRTARQQSEVALADLAQARDTALAEAKAESDEAQAALQDQIAALTEEAESLRAEAEAASEAIPELTASGAPYAGIGGESCAAFLASDGFEGDPKQAEIMEWASGFASGINIGRQLSEEAPMGLAPLGELDMVAEIERACTETGSQTLAGAIIQVILPAFQGIEQGTDQ